MSQPASELQPEVSKTASDPLTRRQRALVLAMGLVFAAMPFFFIGDLQWNNYEIRDLQASGFFFSLGLLPGAIGIAYHMVTATTRRSTKVSGRSPAGLASSPAIRTRRQPATWRRCAPPASTTRRSLPSPCSWRYASPSPR